jgi:uncharacterized integral membrane protein
MRNLKRLSFFVVVLLIVLATVVFVLENQQSVALVFFGWSAPELSVAVPVVLAFLLGMLMGPVLAFILGFGRRRRLAFRDGR